MKLGIGLYGGNGHQLDAGFLSSIPSVQLSAVCGLTTAEAGVYQYDTLDDMLLDHRVELVSLCSPIRARQAADAMLCMQAGRHVYAEKPCALNEHDLDGLMEASARYGVQFHEMAGTAYEEPYATMADIIASGRIGTVVQIFAQKSYPLHGGRPQDEDVDGGLIRQAGIHAVRMIEHVCNVQILEVSAMETPLGNPVTGGGLKIAASMAMRLDNGGVSCVVVNYLNPEGFGLWGNETLRVFGTKGLLEATDGGARTRLILGKEDFGPIHPVGSRKSYFEHIVSSILSGSPPPMPMDRELHCARVVIRAKEDAMRRN